MLSLLPGMLPLRARARPLRFPATVQFLCGLGLDLFWRLSCALFCGALPYWLDFDARTTYLGLTLQILLGLIFTLLLYWKVRARTFPLAFRAS